MAQPGLRAEDEHPVVCVSWNDAVAFCEWLSRKEGKSYRLPTEAEWEYACRSGDDNEVPFGNEIAALGDYAWWSGNSYPRTHAVGGKRPNRFALYDMQGNARQWCADWYDEQPRRSRPLTTRKVPCYPPARFPRRQFLALPIVLRCSAAPYSPSGRRCNFGFRVACDR